MSRSLEIDLSVVRALVEIADVIEATPHMPPSIRAIGANLRHRVQEIVEGPRRQQEAELQSKLPMLKCGGSYDVPSDE